MTVPPEQAATPEPPNATVLETDLRQRVSAAGRAVIAFSGGVDSSVLLRVAVDELGDRALGVMAVGASLPERDRSDALELAGRIGARLELVDTDEFDDPRYLANGEDRCYWCRSSLVRAMLPIAARERAVMMYGAILDDLADDRPGMRAAAEGGILAPLLEAGFRKPQVRDLARRLGLPVWDKPASACLSSRIPTGTAIDKDSLLRVDRAEAAVSALGLRIVRVREEGDSARVELGFDELTRVATDGVLRSAVLEAVLVAGFAKAGIDPAGYRPAGRRHRLPSAGVIGPGRG